MKKLGGKNVIDALYNQLIKATIKQNTLLGEQLGIKQTNYNKLYKKSEIPFDDDRELNIRWVKIPTFLQENKPTYYAVFLVSINYWRKGEMKKIYRQTIETIDSADVDSYTIILIGRLFGYIDKMDRRPKYYHIYRINTNEFTSKERKRVLDCICGFIDQRIRQMLSNDVSIASVKTDANRLQSFVNTFRYMRDITPVCINASNTSNRKNEVLANIKTNTSIRHHNVTMHMEGK